MLETFRTAPCGRLFSATVSFAALSAGLLAGGIVSTSWLSVSVVVLLIVSSMIITVGITIEQFPVVALLLLLALPPLGGIYFAGLTVVSKAGPGGAAAFILVALVAAVQGARPSADSKASKHLSNPKTPGAPSPTH